MVKYCKSCSFYKLKKSFSKDRTRKDGLSNKCKTCVKEYQSKEYVIEIKRKAQRKYSKTKNGIETERRHSPKRHARTKELGRQEVYRIVRSSLEKKPCIICGGKGQAHHEDYTKPLDVMWLCPQHHSDRHKELKNAG